MNHLEKVLGKGKFVIIYGGDPNTFDETKDLGATGNCCDAGFLVKVLHEEFDVPVIATQCDQYAACIFPEEPNGALDIKYAHLSGGAVLVYSTTLRRDAAGLLQLEFGGFNCDGELIGASRIWFDPLIRDLVKYHLVVGGGPVAMKNAEMALFGNHEEQRWEQKRATCNEEKLARIPVLYVPAPALHCGVGQKPGSWLGQTHDYLMQEKIRELMTRSSRDKAIIAGCDPTRNVDFLQFVPK